MMTKVGRLIYEDQLKAVREEDIRIARNFLSVGISVKKIADATGLELSLVEDLAKEVEGNLQTA